MKGNAEAVGLGAGGHGRGRWRSSCPSWLAQWREWVMAPPRLSVRAGIRAVALRLPPCVRAGTSCGGRQVAVWPLPGTNAMCQSGAACGG